MKTKRYTVYFEQINAVAIEVEASSLQAANNKAKRIRDKEVLSQESKSIEHAVENRIVVSRQNEDY